MPCVLDVKIIEEFKLISMMYANVIMLYVLCFRCEDDQSLSPSSSSDEEEQEDGVLYADLAPPAAPQPNLVSLRRYTPLFHARTFCASIWLCCRDFFNVIQQLNNSYANYGYQLC